MNKILNVTVGVLLLSLAALAAMALSGGQPVAQPHSPGAAQSGTNWDAVWYNTPQSAQEAYNLGNVVVVATVSQITQAPDLVIPAKGEPEGVDRVPNQTIILAVNETWKGTIGKSVQVFHTGTTDRWADGDPAYALGEQYVLFLQPRDDGRYVLVSPEGRYAVVNGTVHPMSDQPGVANTTGISLPTFRGLVQGPAPVTK